MLVDYYRIFMWGAQPEAASPAAHQGARHCPLVTRSLVTGSRWWRGSWGRRSTGHWQTPTGARTLETETGPRVTLDTGDWDWPTLVTAATGNIADEADLSRALARRQPHSASDCIICKSHIFIPPPPSPHSRQPTAECLDQARGYSVYQFIEDEDKDNHFIKNSSSLCQKAKDNLGFKEEMLAGRELYYFKALWEYADWIGLYMSELFSFCISNKT